jgi:hypothetical protein
MTHVYKRTETAMQSEDRRPASEHLVKDTHPVDGDPMSPMSPGRKETPEKKPHRAVSLHIDASAGCPGDGQRQNANAQARPERRRKTSHCPFHHAT